MINLYYNIILSIPTVSDFNKYTIFIDILFKTLYEYFIVLFKTLYEYFIDKY